MSTLNYDVFPVGTRVIPAIKANPILQVGEVIEVREERMLVRWERSGCSWLTAFEISPASPEHETWPGTVEEWHAENVRRQRTAVTRFIETHVCTTSCVHQPLRTERSAS